MQGREGTRDGLVDRIVDGAPIVMLVVDAVGTITFCSDASEGVFGYSPEELIGTNMLDRVDLDWNPLALESIGSALEGTGLRLPMLFRVRDKQDNPRVVEVTANSQIQDDVVNGMIVYVRSWNEQAMVDDILEALAADHPIEAKFEMFVSVMAAETLDSDGAVLFAPSGGAFTRSVSAADLDPTLRGDPAGDQSVVGKSPGTGMPWDLVLATGVEQCIRSSELPEPTKSIAAEHGYEWCWAFPVRGILGDVEACLVLWRRDDRPLEEAFRMWIRRLVRLTQLVLEQDESRSRLVFAASRDPLTGLHNRAAFFERFQNLLGEAKTDGLIGVLYLDLDGFKPVNDRFGHGAGDAVLVAIAQRFASRVRDGDLVARIGGDEFAVLCPEIDSPDELEILAVRLADAAREVVTIGAGTVRIGASVGACVARPGDCSIDALLEAADAALYDAKAHNLGGCRIVCFGEFPSKIPAARYVGDREC